MASILGRVWKSGGSDKAASRVLFAMVGLSYWKDREHTKRYNSLAEELQQERHEKEALRARNNQHWEHLSRQLDDRGIPHLKYSQTQSETEGGAVRADGDRPKRMNFIRWPGRETVLASLPQAQSGYFAP